MLLSTLTTYLSFFFFNDTATTEIYTLSLHDALPIYLERLAKARLALRIRNSVHVVDARESAATDPEVEATLADVVHRRGFFGDTQRIVQGEDLERHSDPQARRARGDRAGHDDRRREHRPGGREVHFAQPHTVQPPCLGGVHELEPLAERGRLVTAATYLELH